ncbi:hypothetical protein BDW62DRAFT_216580 [Aspergillus aurantiobrunneus]
MWTETLIKSAFALSALVSSALAATTARAAPFQLVGEHGINVTGGDGALGIQNDDVVYVGTDGHVDLKSIDGIADGGLTEGFTTGSNNILEWAQGGFFAWPSQSFYAAGPDTYMIYASREGANLASNCIQISFTETSV